MGVVLTAVGIGFIVLGLLDMFHTLLHPGGRGRMCQLVLAAFWRISRATGHRLGSAVGPAAMVTVIVLWVALQGVGWALIYYPHVPDGFVYAPGLEPSGYSAFVEALYLSFVTLTTLGFGDVVAIEPWVRAVSPLEALTGFALLTAALAWFTQIYPLLSRRRALALQLKGLADAGYAEAMGDVDAITLSRVLDHLAAEVGRVRVDFNHHTEGFYFQEQSRDLALAYQLPYALRLHDAAQARHEVTVRLSARQLSVALDQLAAELKADFFVQCGDGTEEVFTAYAADHGHIPGR